jgi:hypothetical protein
MKEIFLFFIIIVFIIIIVNSRRQPVLQQQGILTLNPTKKTRKRVSFAPVYEERVFNEKGDIINTSKKQISTISSPAY